GNETGAPGAGLGLPIVDEIANLFNAALTLEPGKDGRCLKAAVTFTKAA
ncbi:sensor histidine kinase, partial [Rhizobium ruizarguesonis]